MNGTQQYFQFENTMRSQLYFKNPSEIIKDIELKAQINRGNPHSSPGRTLFKYVHAYKFYQAQTIYILLHIVGNYLKQNHVHHMTK